MFPLQDVNGVRQNSNQGIADILDSHFSLVFTREVGIISLNNALLIMGEILETVFCSECEVSHSLGKVVADNSR